jgi:hypothetical protein
LWEKELEDEGKSRNFAEHIIFNRKKSGFVGIRWDSLPTLKLWRTGRKKNEKSYYLV